MFELLYSYTVDLLFLDGKLISSIIVHVRRIQVQLSKIYCEEKKRGKGMFDENPSGRSMREDQAHGQFDWIRFRQVFRTTIIYK